MYPTIKLHANSMDVTLIKCALSDLRETIDTEGDKYGISSTITNLITQLEELKGE